MKSFQWKWLLVLLVGALLFGISFPIASGLKARESWVQTQGTITQVTYEEYKNLNWSEGEPHTWLKETFQFTFTRADGSTDSGEMEWSEVHPDQKNRYAPGDLVDVVYDPDSQTFSYGDLPTGADYVMVWALRVVGAGLFLVCLLPVVAPFIKKKTLD